jgi:hypothetical protein
MIHPMLRRGLLAVGLIAGATAGWARAQDTPNGVPARAYDRAYPGQATPGYDDCAPARSKPWRGSTDGDDVSPAPKKGWCCIFNWGGNNGGWSTHNEFNTANFRSEWVFLWGASRGFFGEPYVKGPPIYPFPTWPSYQTCPGYPGCQGWEGQPEYPVRHSPPGYACQPYPPNTPVQRKKDCAALQQP